jgi:hypothetical protein
MSEALSFAKSVYDAVDSMDETNLAQFLTDECTFTFRNAQPVVGRGAAAEASKTFLSLLAGIKSRGKRRMERRRYYHYKAYRHIYS